VYAVKILHEFVPSRNFLKIAEETRNLVDGWNVTDSAAGRPAPSGTAVGCVLKTKYPDKIVIPVSVLRYKGPVEVGGLALAGEAIGLDGLVLTMGDPPKYGGPIEMFKRSEEARDFLRRKVRVKSLKIGCLLTPRRSVKDIIVRVRDAWDFFFFMRLEEKSLPLLKRISEECKRLKKSIYAYFVVETPRNTEVIRMIGWPVTSDMKHAEAFASTLEGIVDGIIATCAGDYEGDIELLKSLQGVRG